MIGDKVKERRIELGWTQEFLAKQMGYKSKSTINKIESNLADVPLSKVKQFACCLQTTPSYLMGWDDRKGYEYYKEHAMEKSELELVMEELNEEGRGKVLEYARLLMASGEYKKRDSIVVGE